MTGLKSDGEPMSLTYAFVPLQSIGTVVGGVFVVGVVACAVVPEDELDDLLLLPHAANPVVRASAATMMANLRTVPPRL